MKTDTKTLAAAIRTYSSWFAAPIELTATLSEAADRLEELERELDQSSEVNDSLSKACSKIEEDKESNARLCESLSAELEQERQKSHNQPATRGWMVRLVMLLP